ncbi:uncharacterized protein LAESUDRAFT_86238 [Laetiporus sulphureus 93-53]|uniref:Uncharacterized protein n=1 Tax=Laetiporus sulphureus 93-53 TaxID=1314785 RepID=A0A165EVI8_9APHY|nr:uncharacterized protein LAESUDRAFT_86238 [Laetiporus sulphureus 93-53]KZT07852.1 hypothetical protein LAESUDRAFT_86238 [Laetiporus sulphureus 93-53]
MPTILDDVRTNDDCRPTMRTDPPTSNTSSERREEINPWWRENWTRLCSTRSPWATSSIS